MVNAEMEKCINAFEMNCIWRMLQVYYSLHTAKTSTRTDGEIHWQARTSVDNWKKKSSKTIDIVSYAVEVSVNGVTCVCS